jgi:hypothetical protein
MIDPKSKLTVLHDDNGTFVDFTELAADLTRDNFQMQLTAAEDYIYIGYEKPFGSLYAEMYTANNNANVFTAQMYNGTSWVALSNYSDESQGFTRSGFMFWEQDDMKATAVNTITKYYIRLKPSANHTTKTVRGINLIFANDAAMIAEFSEITNSNLLPAGEVSHIRTHVSTRNHILQQLRNHYQKLNTSESTSTVAEKINQFDLMDIFEVREAAVYLSLSKIFFNLSDSLEDHWFIKYREYQDMFEKKMTVAYLSIDTDNDGVKDANETQRQFNPTRWAR